MAKTILSNLDDLFKKHIYFSDPILYTFFTVYVVYTYFYDLFDQTPYIGIFGPPDSGKSRLGDLLEGVCFEATLTSDITSAALYRFVDQKRGTLIIDEGLHASNKFDPLNRVLRSGYRRNGRVICCEPGGTFGIFQTYCPKVLIDNYEPDDRPLFSRLISMCMTPSPDPLQKFLYSEVQEEFREAKNLLEDFSSKNRQDLWEKNKSSTGFDGFSNRQGELYGPLFVVSEFLESAIGEPFLFEQMLLLATRLINSKRINELESNIDLQILEGTRAFVEDPNIETIQGNLYVAFQIRDYIRKRWDFPRLSTKKVVQTLGHYHVRGKRERPHVFLGGIKQPVCYPIDTPRLSEITEKYFDGGERK
jgi:hypothetical protein